MTESSSWHISEAEAGEQKYAPATLRNRDAIVEVLREVLPLTGKVLEVASGTGEHIVYFADKFPDLQFQPSDRDTECLQSISSWTRSARLDNIAKPVFLDTENSSWNIADVTAVLCINMVHISPWEASIGLFHNVAKLLPIGAPFYLYGPFIRSDVVTASSNVAFEASLKSRNLRWGIRHLDDIDALAFEAGLQREMLIEMPANNLSLVYKKI